MAICIFSVVYIVRLKSVFQVLCFILQLIGHRRLRKSITFHHVISHWISEEKLLLQTGWHEFKKKIQWTLWWFRDNFSCTAKFYQHLPLITIHLISSSGKSKEQLDNLCWTSRFCLTNDNLLRKNPQRDAHSENSKEKRKTKWGSRCN